MSFISKIEVVFAAGSLNWNRAIHEKSRSIYVVLFEKLSEN